MAALPVKANTQGGSTYGTHSQKLRHLWVQARHPGYRRLKSTLRSHRRWNNGTRQNQPVNSERQSYHCGRRRPGASATPPSANSQMNSALMRLRTVVDALPSQRRRVAQETMSGRERQDCLHSPSIRRDLRRRAYEPRPSGIRLLSSDNSRHLMGLLS